MSRTTPRFIIFFSGYVLFLCIGASMFLAIEQADSIERLENLDKRKRDFLQQHQCVHYRDFENILHDFEMASKKGMHGSENYTVWNFGQSLFFVTAIVTTIGYGHIAPLTSSGKIFTILFAIIGIPLTLSVLSAFVDRLLVLTTALLQWLNSKLESTHQEFTIRLFHLIIVLSIVSVLCMLVPATCYSYIEEDWDFLDSVYYCFLSLTTIGFGDLVPGESSIFLKKYGRYEFVYKLCTIIYLFSGITFLMLTLAVFYNIPELNLGLLYAIDEGDQLSLQDDNAGTNSNLVETPKRTQVMAT